ncbi:473_t:CDS:1 [Rhizophagus irregularis]|nr:473_t:CDS:1 [Rhizophagus irregularis]
MTLPYLTDDCIYYILQYLQNDHSTLFKCLLVNRFWCKSTIPLLYANPFANTTEKNYLITSTLILCFNKAEIIQLKNQLGLSQINNINFDNFDKEHKPLFEYPKYLKYLKNCNNFIINFVISKWFAKYIPNLPIFCVDNIFPIFLQSILRQSRNIEQLDISLNLFYEESFKNFNFQNFTSNLTKLNSLSLNFHSSGTDNTVNKEIEQEFLRNIANFCTNASKLIIELPEIRRPLYQHDTSNDLIITTTTLEKLCTIIQVQNKLKMFKIWDCHSLLNDILLSLEFQKHSLVYVEFTACDFSNVSLKRFNYLYNLEYLKFEYCKGILLNQCESLNFSSFKLKELSFKHNYWNVDVASLMIKYLGASLQRLLVETPSSSLIKNISIYCPNLIFLEIIIDSHIDLSVIQLFKNLRTRILSISTLCDDTDKFFINLANNISINIDKIFINSYSRNSSRLLKYKKYKEFLENCHNRFEMINLKYIIELEFFKIVLNYIERSNNSLKVLGMMKCKKLNDEELKLLNLIKAKGVEIVNYSTIYHDLCKFAF